MVDLITSLDLPFNFILDGVFILAFYVFMLPRVVVETDTAVGFHCRVSQAR